MKISYSLVLLFALAACDHRALPIVASDGGTGPNGGAGGRLGAPCQCVYQEPDGGYLNEPCLNRFTGCADGYLCGGVCTPLCSFDADGGTMCPPAYTCIGGIIAGSDFPQTACQPVH